MPNLFSFKNNKINTNCRKVHYSNSLFNKYLAFITFVEKSIKTT